MSKFAVCFFAVAIGLLFLASANIAFANWETGELRTEALKAVPVSVATMEKLRSIVALDRDLLPSSSLLIPDDESEFDTGFRRLLDRMQLSMKGRFLLVRMQRLCDLKNAVDKTTAGEFKPGGTTVKIYSQSITGANCPIQAQVKHRRSTTYAPGKPLGSSGSFVYEKEAVQSTVDVALKNATQIAASTSKSIKKGEFENRGIKTGNEKSKFVANNSTTLRLIDGGTMTVSILEEEILESGKTRTQALIKIVLAGEVIVIYRGANDGKEEILLNGRAVSLGKVNYELGL